jgi:hypothetical protein
MHQEQRADDGLDEHDQEDDQDHDHPNHDHDDNSPPPSAIPSAVKWNIPGPHHQQERPSHEPSKHLQVRRHALHRNIDDLIIFLGF